MLRPHWSEQPDLEILLRAIESQDGDERLEGAELLAAHARRGRTEERERLHAAFLKLAGDADVDVRLAAGEGLGLLGDRLAATRALNTVLEEGDAQAALYAARELAQLRDPGGADRLLAALAVGHLRFDALEALRMVGDARALEPARKLFNGFFTDRWVRAQAAALLAAQGEREGLDYLRKRAGKRRAAERGLVLELLGELRAEGAYELLLAIAEDRDDPNRTAAVAALGFLGDGRAEEVLKRFAESDPDEDVRDEAREALALMADAAGR